MAGRVAFCSLNYGGVSFSPSPLVSSSIITKNYGGVSSFVI